MEFIKAKTILSKMKDGNNWFGIDYNMNLYKGCSHACIYCDSRSNCYHIDNFDTVRAKKNELNILESELVRKRKKGIVGIGSMSDTYNPQEIKYEITRGALKLISKYGFGVSIDTKSDLIVRDIDLLKEINNKNSVIIKFTITTSDDNLSKVIEQNVVESSKRLSAIKELSDNGIFIGIMMTPVLPYITDNEENIKKLVKLAHENGAKFIYTYMGMTLRENQREYYYSQLDKHFKGLKNKYISTYGEQYSCNVPNYKNLYNIFKNECNKYGLLYKMEDIIKAYKKEKNIEENKQITLFN
ncbi:MAG: radical SAM protein [Clostridiaceae bacterium]|nr:radical SAM protein [Clostridiaceae bacterium]